MSAASEVEISQDAQSSSISDLTEQLSLSGAEKKQHGREAVDFSKIFFLLIFLGGRI